MNEWSEENCRARYRAWDKTREIMRHVITRIDWLVDGRPIRVHWCTSEIEDGVIDNFDFILFQSTGLRDSKGVEIWEGSIITATNSDYSPEEEGPWVVIFQHGAFFGITKDGEKETWLPYWAHSQITVIGNTVEHPELKEVRK